jgi:nitrite reductase/ring-hydroxylating ferredoxin subunit
MTTALCRVSDIPEGNARGFDLGSQRYIVVRREDGISVFRNECPHLGIPLEWQPDHFMDPDGELLQCSTHGALFLPDSGECISGPCVGKFLMSVPFSCQEDTVLLQDWLPNE